MTGPLLGNRFKAKVVAEEVEIPKGFWGRLRLWVGKSKPESTHAILFHSAAVHTVGMRFAVDVAFLSQKWKVLELVRGLRPFRGAGPVKGAALVLMMPAGALSEQVIAVGDELEWVPRTGDRVAGGAKPPTGF